MRTDANTTLLQTRVLFRRNLHRITTQPRPVRYLPSRQSALAEFEAVREFASGRAVLNSANTERGPVIETFMLCDLFRYELSASGSMRGTEAGSIIDSILRLPRDSAAYVELTDVSTIDEAAAEAFATAVRHQRARGVELSIVVGTGEVRVALHAAGLAGLVVGGPETQPA